VATLRTAPSGGGLHEFETYLAVSRVSELEPGLYRYLALEHKLLFLRADPNLSAEIVAGCGGQGFVGEAAVVFVWTTFPYRMEWRYSIVASKVIALDAGHVCQNLYLASESIGAGACAMGAYDQKKMDAVLGVDGKDEFTIYAAPVGKIA
jgi:SagB-type dehydrogenase family enzyme